MAGHSKFKNIMYRKGAQDLKRAKQFARITREITLAARSGLSDPDKNPKLRTALALARAANMPKDNVQKAIDKASAADADQDAVEITYEGYGPAGIAVIVEALTDNKNRTASEIRSTFSKHGGNLGESGSVSYLFKHVGFLNYALPHASEEVIIDFGASHDAEDVFIEDGHTQFIVSIDHFASFRNTCLQKWGDPTDYGLMWLPLNTITLDAEQQDKFNKFVEALEDKEDVQNVFSNVSDEL